jgi:hypothetical protein
MRLRRKARIIAADVEDDRRTATTRKKAVVGSDDEGSDNEDDQAMIQRQVPGHVVLASSPLVPTKSSKARWRSRLLPSSLRRRRKRRKDLSSAASPQTSHPRVPRFGHDVDESSDEDSEAGSNVAHSRPGSHLSSRRSSRSLRLPTETTASLVSSPAERGAVSTVPHSPANSPHPNIPPANIRPPSATRSGRQRQVELDRSPEIMSPDDEDVEALPAYGPQRTPAFYSHPPLPQSRDAFISRELGVAGVDDADYEAVACDMTEGHVATDDKAALARLAQMRSEPAVELSPPSLSSSSSGRREMLPAADLLIQTNANVPDEDDIVLHEASAIRTIDLDVEVEELARQHGPRAESNHGMRPRNSASSSSKLSNDTLPAHISHTTRASAQTGENDEVPSYEESRIRAAVNTLPQPMVHEATAREYARLAVTSPPPSTSTSALLGFTTCSKETSLRHVLSTPAPEARALLEAGECEDLGSPSAPPFEELDDREKIDDEVHPSAPPLDAFPEDNTIVSNAPPEWDE